MLLCSAGQMFVDNSPMTFEALVRKITNNFVILFNHLTISENAIVTVFIDDMVTRRNCVWKYWSRIFY